MTLIYENTDFGTSTSTTGMSYVVKEEGILVEILAVTDVIEALLSLCKGG
jgi:hypothetical protein